MENPIAKHPLSVGDLRRLIKDLPDDTKVFNDVVDGPEEYKAGITSLEVGIPENWQGVEGAESGLWFHVRITPMENEEEDACDECGAIPPEDATAVEGRWHKATCSLFDAEVQ